MSRLSPEQLQQLQSNSDSIRNICILAHVDHGKTTLSDCLLSSNGIISSKLSGKVRYLDFRPDEQERGITMKSCAIALFFSLVKNIRNAETDEVTQKNMDYLINLIDSPGHVDFASEVSTASRLCDGALVLVDAVEGVCTQTHTVLRQAWAENVRPILVLNKIDRLILELKMTPDEAYIQLNQILEQVNAILGSLYAEVQLGDATRRYEEMKQNNAEFEVDISADGKDELHQSSLNEDDLYFSPEKGNVIFASAIDGWAFRVDQFASLYASKLKISEPLLRRVLWGDFFLDTKSKRVVGRKGLKGRSLKPMFVQFVLENIWAVYDAVLINTDRDRIEKIVNTLGIKVLPRDLKSKDVKALIKTLMSQWLPLSKAVLISVIQSVPAPHLAQQKRLPSIIHDIPGLNNPSLLKSVYECDSSESAPTVAFVSKMFGMDPDMIPPREVSRDAQRKKAMEEARALAMGIKQSEERQVLSLSTNEEKAKEEVLIGFARIYSGQIKVGQKIHVLGPKYRPGVTVATDDSGEHHSEATVERLFLLMGRDVKDVEVVPAGNVFGIMGLQSHVLKSATLSSTLQCPNIAGLKLDASSVVRVALEPEHPGDMKKLVAGLKMLNQADPVVQVHIQDTGEHVIVCAGELHLERCLKDLRERFARIPIHASSPIVPFRETIIDTPSQSSKEKDQPSSGTNSHQPRVTVSSSNGSFVLEVEARKLPMDIVDFIESSHDTLNAILNADMLGENAVSESEERSQKLIENLMLKIEESEDWKIDIDRNRLSEQVICFGPRNVGANILLDTTNSLTSWLSQLKGQTKGRGIESEESSNELYTPADITNSIISAFQVASASGPLCAEPMSGICYIIRKIELTVLREEQNFGSLSGMVISLCKEAFHESFLKWSPRLMLAIYKVELQTPVDILGKVFAVLSRRRGRITAEDMKEGTTFYHIEAILPVIESFGFSDELRKKSSGAAHPQLMFAGFEILDEDPFWVPTTEEELEDLGEKADKENLARKYMDGVRERKGMAVEKKVVEHAEKQKTLKKD